MLPPPADDVIVRVVRSGFVEGTHRGSAVGLDASGAAVVRRGDPDAPVFPRSSHKPLQAVGLLRCGLDLDGELLALAAASHSGEPFHVDGVRRVLATHGLDEADLGTPADLPLDDAERARWLVAGRAPAPVAMNCSGKHAAMLATCVVNGWPTAGYLDPAHPLQRAVRAAVTDLAGEQPAAVGVDGCGAPLLALSLVALARAFARLAVAEPATAEGRVARAVRSHPEWVGGTGREVTRLVAGVPGLVAKDGAEAVWAAALPDGRAAAVKVTDGAQRASTPVLAALLTRLGATAAVIDELAAPPVLGGGAPVGALEVVLDD